VNKEIEVFSRKLHQLMKTADNVKITQANLSTNDITLHELQVNISGKEKMAELTSENIKKKLMARKEEATIILVREESQKGSY